MINDNENNLIIKAQKGDIFAFEELISVYETKIYNWALYLCKNPEDAKDISQQALLKAWLSIKNFRRSSLFSTWLFRIINNVFQDELRKKPKKYQIYFDDVSHIEREGIMQFPDEILRKKEISALIRSKLQEMEKELASVIVLYDIQGFKYEEIAEIMNIPLGTVKSRLSRARRILKEKIGDKIKELL